MVEYFLNKISFKNNMVLPTDIINIIKEYLPLYHVNRDIKNKNYCKDTGFWYKRIIKQNIIDIRRDEIRYYDWFKIFHYKDYSILIRYENQLVKKLLETKTKEEIEAIHMYNLDNCHKKHFMNYKF